MKILVTGAAGFIGFHVAKNLLDRGDQVFGIDNINDYYEPALKHARLAQLTGRNGFTFEKMDIAEREKMQELFEREKFDRVAHLAAQAGVRYSLVNPHAYIDSNVTGFMNILEGCRHNDVEHLAYASSSSVYGANESLPFSVHDNVDHPVSLYAATKKSNELMAHTYAHLYGLPVTGLRFFTVYGPWGRPDMAFFLFTKSILAGEPITLFNNGNLSRDFTYIDDITEGVVRALDKVASANPDWTGKQPDPGSSSAPYRLYNIGNNQPVELMDFVAAIEKAVGKPAKKLFKEMQPGDVERTAADIDDLVEDIGFQPRTDIYDGIAQFVRWYKSYYGA